MKMERWGDGEMICVKYSFGDISNSGRMDGWAMNGVLVGGFRAGVGVRRSWWWCGSCRRKGRW